MRRKEKDDGRGEKVEADVLHVDMGEGREGESILWLNLHMKKAEIVTYRPSSCLNGKKLHKEDIH